MFDNHSHHFTHSFSSTFRLFMEHSVGNSKPLSHILQFYIYLVIANFNYCITQAIITRPQFIG